MREKGWLSVCWDSEIEVGEIGGRERRWQNNNESIEETLL